MFSACIETVAHGAAQHPKNFRFAMHRDRTARCCLQLSCRCAEQIDVRGNAANVLQLNVSAIQNLGGGETVRIRSGSDDTVRYGTGWAIEQPQMVSGVFVQMLTADTSKIEVHSETPYQNSLNRFDVSGDGSISPIDVLMIINALNTPGNKTLTTPTTSPSTPFVYFDTSGDNFISPIDALLVINAINSGGQSEGEVRFLVAGHASQPLAPVDESLAYWDAAIDWLAQERRRRRS